VLNIGDRIGDWIVVEKLGEGGMGAVFRCHNVLSDKIQSAVKVLKSHDLGEARKRFVREVELLATVRHPAIVQILGAGIDEQRELTWMAMELLDGEDLSDRLKRGPLEWAEASRLFKILGEGLLAAHDKGVVHRDIKPPNIMICSDGSPKLLDFGIAVQAGATKLTQDGLVPGTVAYIAPEVFEGDKPDHRADIYAMGLVLWEALTGREAFPEDGVSSAGQSVVKIMGDKLRSEPMDPGSGFPEPLRDLVRHATDPEVDTRLHHMDEFVRVLAETGEHRVRKAGRRRTTTGRTRARKRSKGWVWALGGAGMATVVALVVLGLAGVVIGVVALAAGYGMFAAPLYVADPSPSYGAPVPSGMPGSPYAAKVPEGFPFEVTDDAKIMAGMKSESGGQVSYVVSYTTQEDAEPLVKQYEDVFRSRGMEVSTSTVDSGYGITYTASGWSMTEVATASGGPAAGVSGNMVSVTWVPMNP